MTSENLSELTLTFTKEKYKISYFDNFFAELYHIYDKKNS
jgi:hypothetical protein